MTALSLVLLAAGIGVEYRLVECPASAVRPDLARQELRKLWRDARDVAAFEVSAREGEAFRVFRRSSRKYVSGYDIDGRRARPRLGELSEGMMLWGRARKGGEGLILDTWVLLESASELREFKTRWGRLELPSVLVGGTGTSALLRPKKTAMVCAWQLPGSEGKAYALLARGRASDEKKPAAVRQAHGAPVASKGAVRPEPQVRAGAREAWFDYTPPPFVDGDIQLPLRRRAEPELRAAAEPVREEPVFLRVRLLRVKASVFDSSSRRPGGRELENWLRRKDARVVGYAALSSFSGQRVCAFWARRTAYFAGRECDRSSVRWVASGAAVGLRAKLQKDAATAEARAWSSEFDEPFRTRKTSLGPVELPSFRFSSMGECSTSLKPGEEGVVCASPLEGGAMLLITAKVERVPGEGKAGRISK